MNNKIKLSVGLILSVFTLFGLFAVATPASAMTCNSATLTGNVTTGTPPTHARFTYSPSYSSVMSGGGTPTTVQIFNTEGTFPIQQFISGLSESTTYYYRLEVTNNYGTSNLNIENFTTPACATTTPAPTVSISANPTSVLYNGTSQVTWSSNNATSCIGTNFNTNNAVSGSTYTGNLTSNTTYGISCTNSAGQSATASTTVVVGTQVQNPTVTLTADNPNVTYGGSTYLRWSSANATYCYATNFNTNNTTSGNYYASNLTATTTYNITCTNSVGSANATVTVSVAGTQTVTNPTVTLTADNASVTSGNSTYIRWTSANATSCVGSNFSTNNTLSGTYYTGALYSTTTYSINCSGANGTTPAYASTTVSVGQISNPTGTITATSCTIPSGSSTCNSQVAWSSSNLIPGANTAVTRNNSTNTTVSTATSGNTSVAVNFGTTTFFLYHNGGNPLDTASAEAACAVNTSWNGTVCSPTQSSLTVTLTADNTNVVSGGSTYIRWFSPNASSCVGTNFNTNNLPSGNAYTGALYSSTTYVVNCINSTGGSATASVTITVAGTQVQNPTVTLTADSTSIISGGSTYIRWNSTNATSCFGMSALGSQSSWGGTKNTSGSYNTGALYITTAYDISCTNSIGQSATASVTVVVNGTQNLTPTVSLTADNSYVTYNNSTYLRWSSTNATSCIGTNFSSNNTTSGSYYTGALTYTTTYSIICTNSTGQQANASVTIIVNNQQNQTPTVSTNGATNLGANYATLNGYVNSNGGTSVNAWFEWGTNSYYNSQTNQVNYGSTSGTPYSYYLTGLAQNTTYYYRAAAQSSNGQIVYGSQMVFTTTGGYNGCTYNCYNNNQPIVTTYSATGINTTSALLNGYVDPSGSSYTTRWFEWGTNNSYLYTSTSKISQGSYAGNFSESIYGLSPNTMYYYRAAALGNNGSTVYGNTLTLLTTGNNYNTCSNSYYGNTTACAPTAITSMATNIGSTSARLNGLALVQNAVYTTGYFEYGINQNLGNSTVSKSIGSTTSNPFSESVYNLASNTTYYYRAVVTNQYGTSRGDIVSFNTGSPITYVDTTDTHIRTVYRNTTVVTNTNDTTGTSRPSLVFLTVSRNGEIITKGSTIEYVVNYKNVSSKNLKDIVLQVSLPSELKFIEASRGSFSTINNTLVANIGYLNSQEEGSVRITVQVSDNIATGKIIVVTANLAYTIVDTNVQEEVFAYSKNTVEDTSGGIQLGALAFLFGNGFFPSTLLGWLLIILFLVLLILAIRKSYYGPIRTITTTTSADHNTTTEIHH